jgi:hypothetical protein
MAVSKESSILADIQAKLKAPKGQFNSFGKYKYRSCEDIVEAVKPIINPLGFSLTLSDEIVLIGDRYYVKATATISNGANTHTVTSFAREEAEKKGMDGSQITGAASSYARKYALNGLFAIDDTKDSDETNDHGKAEPKVEEAVVIPETKPFLSQKQFDAACRRMADGDGTVYQKTIDSFRIKPEYKKILDEEHQKWSKFYTNQ